MSQNLRNYTKAVYGLDAVVQRVPGDQWNSASKCDGWSVQDVVAHAAGVMDAVATMAETGQVAFPQDADVSGGVVAAWNQSRDRVLGALDRPGAVNKAGEYWFGPSTIDKIIAFSLYDGIAHAWDIASAIGMDPCSSQDLAEAALASLDGMGDGMRALGLIADPVEVPADADAMTRFLGATGRNPNS
jgi:uncharacterized protein (TIGR03086 family)